MIIPPPTDRATGAPPASAAAGLALFLALTFSGTWAVASTLRVFELNVAPEALGTRMLSTSLLYAVTMGWQPLLATLFVRRWVDPADRLDLGLRPARARDSVAAAAGALALALAASLSSLLLARAGLLRPASLHGAAERAAGAATAAGLGAAVAALLLTMALVGAQAVTEEVAWRGYFLPHVMERFGRWAGLLLHGVVWGLWYAPVLFFALYAPNDTGEALARGLAFVVTCSLLGTLLGWLRLAAGSVAPVILANVTLTLVAGLPYVLHGVDAGHRSAAYLPAGWLALLAAIAALGLSRHRHAVRTPVLAEAAAADAPLLVRVWWVVGGRRLPTDLPN